MKQITDEMIAEAVNEYDRALMEQLPDPEDCHHEFSAEFEQKMAELMGREKK